MISDEAEAIAGIVGFSIAFESCPSAIHELRKIGPDRGGRHQKVLPGKTLVVQSSGFSVLQEFFCCKTCRQNFAAHQPGIALQKQRVIVFTRGHARLTHLPTQQLCLFRRGQIPAQVEVPGHTELGGIVAHWKQAA